MRKINILLTGGGTGGHIFPLIAVAETLFKIKGAIPKISYLGPKNVLNNEFKELDVKVYHLASSKLRRYFSVKNFLDIPKFFWSILQSIFWLYVLMPDVVFSKGGPGALPVVLVARFYFIPVIIHESDTVPGLTNRISGKLAKKVAVSFLSSGNYFSKNKVIFSGNPVREGLFLGKSLDSSEAKVSIGFNNKEPLILILGGSQGSQRINSFVTDNLEKILSVSQVYHQTGDNNFEEVRTATKPLLEKMESSLRNRYRQVPFLSSRDLREVLSAADLVISRSGSGAIFEIAASEKPSILIPLAHSASDHQRKNAYEYAEKGSALVIEEDNFTINIFLVQLKNLLENKEKYSSMKEAAKTFFKPNASEVIGQEIIRTAIGK